VVDFTSRICSVCLAEWAANSNRNWYTSAGNADGPSPTRIRKGSSVVFTYAIVLPRRSRNSCALRKSGLASDYVPPSAPAAKLNSPWGRTSRKATGNLFE